MENENTSSGVLNKIASSEQLYGTVPNKLEVTVTCVCLGAPIQYYKDKITGLTSACMIVPTANGVQPAIVTYGKEESLGKGAYEALYHQLGCEELIGGKSNKEAANFLIEKFNSKFNLGVGNNYVSTVLAPKFEIISKEILASFPEYASQFTDFKNEYTEAFGNYYSNGKNKEEASDEKKTTIAALSEQMAQTSTQVNV